MPGADGIPVLIGASFDLARGDLGEHLDHYRPLMQRAGMGIIADLVALGLAEQGERSAAATIISSSADLPDPDYLWLGRQVLRARLWSTLADQSALAALAADLEPYAGRVAIGGTGIALFGAVDRSLAIVHHGLGHHQVAAAYASRAQTLNQALDITVF